MGVGQRKGKPKGLRDPKQVQDQIETASGERVTPPLPLAYTVLESEGSKILRVEISKGAERPYCIDGHKFYVRDESDTNMAVRDEIVALVLEAHGERQRSGQKSGRGEESRRSRQPPAWPRQIGRVFPKFRSG